MTITKTVELVLTEEMVNAVNEALATRSNKSFEQVVAQAFALGIKQLNYRTERNREQYAAFKEWKSQK